MKCPQCGAWNQASLPRCFRCGAPLSSAQPPDTSWKEALAEVEPENVYITFEEAADPAELSEHTKEIKEKETLGREMEELKERRVRGQDHLQKLRATARATHEAIANASIIRPVGEVDEDTQPPGESAQDTAPVEELPKGRRSRRRRQAGDADADTGTQKTPAPEHPPQEPRSVTQALVDARPWERKVFVYVDEEDAPVLYDGYVRTPVDMPPRDTIMQPSDPMFYEHQMATWAASQVDTVATTAYRRKGVSSRTQKALRKGMAPGVRIALWAVVLILAAGGTTAGVLWAIESLGMRESSASAELTRSTIDQETNAEGVPVTRINIEGREGTQIYIKELNKSYVVTGGMAVIEIPDYTWFENRSDIDTDTMEVTLTPYIKYSAGEQKAMSPIVYTINVPLSSARLVRPDSQYLEVSTSIFEIRLQVDRGSSVIIDGDNVTSMIDANGYVSKNVQVQPTGENRIAVSVRNNYAREYAFVVTLYRAPQELSLEMIPTMQSESDSDTMQITGTTVQGATISIESPHVETSLDLTDQDESGLFSFQAYFPHIGDNEVVVRAQLGDKQAVVTHVVYYMPNADVYTRRAWPMDAANYTDIVKNVDLRKNQIYLCTGRITEILSDRPQIAIMNTGTDEVPRNVVIDNSTKTHWELGKKYDLYADAYTLYGTMPRLTARYTYEILDPTEEPNTTIAPTEIPEEAMTNPPVDENDMPG